MNLMLPIAFVVFGTIAGAALWQDHTACAVFLFFLSGVLAWAAVEEVQ